MSIENEVREVFERKGIFIPEGAEQETLSIDSLQFVSILVDLEEVFEVAIDDSFLIQNKLHNLVDFIEVISNLIKEKN